MRLRPVTTLLLCLPLFVHGPLRSQEAPVPPADTYDLSIRAQAGDQLTSEHEVHYSLDNKSLLSGSNEALENTVQKRVRTAATHEILEVDRDGAVLRERREYVQTRQTDDDGASRASDPLGGALLELQKGTGETPCTVSVVESENELNEGHTSALRLIWTDFCVLPARPVSLNDSWKIDAGQLRPLIRELTESMVLGSFEVEGGIDCTLKEVTDKDSLKIANVPFNGRITMTGDFWVIGEIAIGDEEGIGKSKVTLALENLTGSFRFDLTRGVPVSIDLTCDIQTEATQSLMSDLALMRTGNGKLEFNRIYTLKRKN